MNITADETITLLREMIRIPSFSGDEEKCADKLSEYFAGKGIRVKRAGNNLYVENRKFDRQKPTILLNSHLDTVKPNKGWRKDPFDPVIHDRKLFGLGSNDAGGALVSLMAAFLYFFDQKGMKYNLVFLASAEEEISGRNGIELVLPDIPAVSFGIVGEPTGMQLAIAEKGLMVVDCKAIGKSGHAARDEGINAIDIAISDIEWIRKFRFPEISEYLGEVKMTVTMINAGTQHNVIPDECHFVIDVRSTDVYSNDAIYQTLEKNLKSEVKARSTRLRPSFMPADHEVVKAAHSLGIPLFGSSTLSDQALLPFPTVKIGPGESARSHTADEFILVDEIGKGIDIYIKLLKKLL